MDAGKEMETTMTRAAVLLTLCLTAAAPARAEHPRARQPGDQRCLACPKCSHKVCVPKAYVGKEEKSCFYVEYKEVCIPAITFPWEERGGRSHASECGTRLWCPMPRCGRVKVVKTLRKHEYKCPKCDYKWKPQCFCKGSRNAARPPEPY